ncbi:GL12582 [Drosophila persimilis]|uniref:GL12582 n=1 Tax=Drosophila persimilis TaxID=7234 RepID=B4GLJ7_DROPE|nr:GL12582 [Drosophila persimilis]
MAKKNQVEAVRRGNYYAILDVPETYTKPETSTKPETKMTPKMAKNRDPKAGKAFKTCTKIKACDEGQRKEPNYQSLLTILNKFIAVMIFFLVVGCLFRSPSYRPSKSEDFPVECLTANRKIPYYIAPNQNCFPTKREMDVEEKYLDSLKASCVAEVHYRDVLLAHANNHKTPSCDWLNSKLN